MGADAGGVAEDTGETADPPQLNRSDEVNTASSAGAPNKVNRWNVRGIAFTMTAKSATGEITKERVISVHWPCGWAVRILQICCAQFKHFHQGDKLTRACGRVSSSRGIVYCRKPAAHAGNSSADRKFRMRSRLCQQRYGRGYSEFDKAELRRAGINWMDLSSEL